jgi:hypothetical protein
MAPRQDRAAFARRLRNAAAAVHLDVVLDFAREIAAEQTASGMVDPEQVEKSVVAQIGLAFHVSPFEAARLMRMGRDLHDGLDGIRALFATGQVRERQVEEIVAATSHLDANERAEIDGRLIEAKVETLGVWQTRTLAQKLAAEVSREKFEARTREARAGRHVGIRSAPDGMAYLSAKLPMEQAVACMGALRKADHDAAVSPEPVTRGRGAIMADTLVERITGQAVATDVTYEVQVLVPVEALLDPSSPLPAQIPGFGPIPADLILNSKGCKAWRQLVTSAGIVIGGDSRRRTFAGPLADMIRARDGGRCRKPYCDAPIRHIDRIHRWSAGGRTTFENGRGLCAFHHLVRETPGWKAEVVVDGMIVTTTPCGHTYSSGLVKSTGRHPRRDDPIEGPDG